MLHISELCLYNVRKEPDQFLKATTELKDPKREYILTELALDRSMIYESISANIACGKLPCGEHVSYLVSVRYCYMFVLWPSVSEPHYVKQQALHVLRLMMT
jgi:hypothetical protein